jgi:drug/metabolite transporter (DMT)-like permease
MHPTTRSLIEIHAAVLLFGLAGLFGKLLALPSTIIVLGRVIFASLALLILLGVQRKSLRLHTRRDVGLFALLGIVLAIHWTTFFQSIQVSTVAVGLLAFSTFPMFVTFIEPAVFREKVRLRELVLALIIFVGAVLIIPEFDLSNNITQGVLWGLASAATFALLTVLNRKAVRDYSAQHIALFQDTVAAVVLLPFLFVQPVDFALRDILLLILLGVVFTALAHSLYIGGMRHVRAHTASLIASLEPVYGILAALILFGEVPGVRVMIGGLLILGVAVYSSMRKTL